MRNSKVQTKDIKAVPADTCERCGEKKAPNGCREVLSGSYCVNPYHLWRLNTRPPRKDPVPAEVAQAMDEWQAPVSEAEQAVDEVLERFKIAQDRSYSAALAALKEGVDDADTPGFMDTAGLLGPDPGQMVFDGNKGYVRLNQLSPEQKNELRRTNREARETLQLVEEELGRARRKLREVEVKRERAVLVARDRARGHTPE